MEPGNTRKNRPKAGRGPSGRFQDRRPPSGRSVGAVRSVGLASSGSIDPGATSRALGLLLSPWSGLRSVTSINRGDARPRDAAFVPARRIARPASWGRWIYLRGRRLVRGPAWPCADTCACARRSPLFSDVGNRATASIAGSLSLYSAVLLCGRPGGAHVLRFGLASAVASGRRAVRGSGRQPSLHRWVAAFFRARVGAPLRLGSASLFASDSRRGPRPGRIHRGNARHLSRGSLFSPSCGCGAVFASAFVAARLPPPPASACASAWRAARSASRLRHHPLAPEAGAGAATPLRSARGEASSAPCFPAGPAPSDGSGYTELLRRMLGLPARARAASRSSPSRMSVVAGVGLLCREPVARADSPRSRSRSPLPRRPGRARRRPPRLPRRRFLRGRSPPSSPCGLRPRRRLPPAARTPPPASFSGFFEIGLARHGLPSGPSAGFALATAAGAAALGPTLLRGLGRTDLGAALHRFLLRPSASAAPVRASAARGGIGLGHHPGRIDCRRDRPRRRAP